MELKTIAAETTATTDLGEFTAIAAAWTVDREKDQIKRGAFAGTIKRWRDSGKPIPLHWDHRGEPQNIIGEVDPSSMQETDDGLFVKGKVDLNESDIAKHAWRLIKNGRVGLSFGYLATKKNDRHGGGRDLHELDVFEISVTPAPMNADTRILEAKSETALRQESEQIQRDVVTGDLPDVEVPTGDDEPESDPLAEIDGRIAKLEELVEKQKAVAELPSEQNLRRQSDRVERQLINETLPEVVAETKDASSVGPAARAQLRGLMAYYMKKEHPFTECVRDNTKRFGAEGAQRVCATLKDVATGTTKWRNQEKAATTTEPDWEQILYDAADGNLEALLEMWHEWTTANGDIAQDDNAPAKSLPPEIEERLDKLEQLLEKSIRGQETIRSRPADPVRRRSEQVALEIQSGGISLRKSPPVTEPPKAQAPSEDSLRRETRDLYREILNSAIGVRDDDTQ